MKILVDAFTEKNFGDDLFLKILFNRYSPKIKWYVICNSIEKLSAFREYDNVKCYNKKINKYKDFDMVINIGGSIFIQNRYWWIKQLFSRLKYSIPMKLYHRPVFIIGCNFGPYHSKLMYLCNKLFIKFFVSDICFRDKDSFNLFKDIKHCRYSPDIVYGLKVGKATKLQKSKIGICIMRFNDNILNENFINKMVEVTKAICRENEQSITFFSFFKRNKDAIIYYEIRKKLEKNIKQKISLVEYEGNIDDFLMRISNCKAIITCRFHSLVLAQLMNISYYPIIYSNKTLNVLKDQNYPYAYTTINEIGNLNIEDLILQLNKKPITFHEKKESEKNFLKIDKYINNKLSK